MQLPPPPQASAPVAIAASAALELLHLLEEWRGLTELETAAIGREDWTAVAEHQGRKKGLRDAMTEVQQHQHPQPASPPAGAEAQRFKALLAEVVAMERRNSEVLSAKRQQRQMEFQRLQQSSRQLHGLRRAYGTGPQSWWQSYS